MHDIARPLDEQLHGFMSHHGLTGAILVFVPAIGTVLEPTLLGGGKQMVMGTLIQTQFGGGRNWPFGAAIAVFHDAGLPMRIADATVCGDFTGALPPVAALPPPGTGEDGDGHGCEPREREQDEPDLHDHEGEPITGRVAGRAERRVTLTGAGRRLGKGARLQ